MNTDIWKAKIKLYGFILLLFLSCVSLAQDSPQWRGPNRDGTISQFKAPVAWPDQLNLKWKTAVGSGISAPVVFENRIWIHTRKGEEEVVSCLDVLSGKILWAKSYPAPFEPHPAAMKIGKGPFSTPVLFEGKLFTFGITAILSCFDANSGALLWRKEFGRIDTSKMFTGTAMSPLVENGSVLVQAGDDTGASFFALHATNGKEIWKWTGDGAGYASPIMAEFYGVRQVVAMTNQAVIGISPQSGELLWRMLWPDDMSENIVTPVQYKNSVIISNAKNGAAAVEIVKIEKQWTTRLAWHTPDIVMYMSSPVLDDDFLFGMSDKRKGQFFCLNAATGKVSWVTNGQEGMNASLLQTKDLLFLLNDKGKLTVAKKNRTKFDPIAAYPVAKGTTLAHLVITDSQFLIKDEQNLALWSPEK